MERLAGWIYNRLEKMHKKPVGILYNSAVREDLQALESVGNITGRQKEYVMKKISVCSLIVVCGVLLSAGLWIKEGIAARIDDDRIERNLYGDGAKNVLLAADDGTGTYYIPITIEEKHYTQTELLEMSKEAIPVLEQSILGENSGLDAVMYDVRLIQEIDGYPFDIAWRVDEEYMDCEGRLVRNRLDSPVLVELTAVLTYESFEMEHSIMMKIYDKAIQPGRAELIAKAVQEREQESRGQQSMTLPSEIDNRNIRWGYKKSYTGLLFLAATPILAVLVYIGRDRDLHAQVMNREEQMRADYPEIVSSLALLVGAGMTVPNAWNKIAKDYKNRKTKCKADMPKRYAYEEMLLTVYEMESGVSQAKAYEQFGRRCRIPDYNKLSAMLSQNIRKGAANLPGLLKEEAADAFENRKHTARKQGEKAGTKLLVPMMMLLGITMVIIMVPAFRTYL